MFIIGMQKSGTSLFNRMLMHQDFISNPFLPEGKYFWGDNPPHCPNERPCGALFQKYKGNNGHYLDESYVTEEDKKLLYDRISQANISEPILMNKNPNNSVRIKWLKSIFPEGNIIAIYRSPIANIFSLSKKYYEKENNILYKDGWWGTKPKNWKELLSEDKIEQCSKQWVEINKELIHNEKLINMVVNYDYLCQSPEDVIKQVIKFNNQQSKIKPFPKITNFNYEYRKGSRIQSKNVELRKKKTFCLANLDEKIEVPPLTNKQINIITEITNETWLKLKNLKKNFC